MIIREIRVLEGANYWSRFPVLEAWVDLQGLKDQSSDEMPGFNARLMGWLPTLIEHRCSVGTRGGFFERLRRGTYLAHILEHVSLELQTLAGSSVGFGRARETHESGVYRVAVAFETEALARASLEIGTELCLAAVFDRTFDVPAEVKRLRQVASQASLSQAAQTLLAEARSRRIPVLRTDGLNLQLGYGRQQQQRIVDGDIRCRVEGDSTDPRTEPSGRIPIVGIAEGAAGGPLARLIGCLVACDTQVVGLASADGAFVGARPLVNRPRSYGESARRVLADPSVDTAVLQADAQSILRSGLVFDACEVAVVTRLEPLRQPGMEWVDEPEYMIRIQRSVVEAVPPTGSAVLNAAHDEVAAMADACAGRVILFSPDHDHPRLQAHRQSGGHTVSLGNVSLGNVSLGEVSPGTQEVILATGTNSLETVLLEPSPDEILPEVGLDVDHLLAAVGAGWSLPASTEQMRAAWTRFASERTSRTMPARKRERATARTTP